MLTRPLFFFRSSKQEQCKQLRSANTSSDTVDGTAAQWITPLTSSEGFWNLVSLQKCSWFCRDCWCVQFSNRTLPYPFLDVVMMMRRHQGWTAASTCQHLTPIKALLQSNLVMFIVYCIYSHLHGTISYLPIINIMNKLLLRLLLWL